MKVNKQRLPKRSLRGIVTAFAFRQNFVLIHVGNCRFDFLPKLVNRAADRCWSCRPSPEESNLSLEFTHAPRQFAASSISDLRLALPASSSQPRKPCSPSQVISRSPFKIEIASALSMDFLLNRWTLSGADF
jgi:hypothetical protein